MRFAIALLLFCTPAYADVSRCDVENGFSPNQGAEAKLVETINQAKQSIHLSAYQLTSKPIIQALNEAVKRKIEVQIVLDKSQKSNVYPFPVRINYHYKIMHNKVFVIDDALYMTGSYNFTYNAEHKNAENFTIVSNCQGDAVQRYQDKFKYLWDQSK